MSMALETFPAPWWAPARFPRVASVLGWSGPKALVQSSRRVSYMSMALETFPAPWWAPARFPRVASVLGWSGPKALVQSSRRVSYMSMALETFPAPWWAPARFPRVASVWGWSGLRASASILTASLRVRAVCGRPMSMRHCIVLFRIVAMFGRSMRASWGE